MNGQNGKTESGLKKYLLFILAVFCFIGIPASILFYSVYRYYKAEDEQLAFDLKRNAQRMVSDLRRNLSAEEYICRFFHEYSLNENRKNETADEAVSFCKQLREFYGGRIDFVAITKDGEIKYNTTSFEHPVKDWIDAYQWVRYLKSFNGDRRKGDSGSIEAVRRILGPLFFEYWISLPTTTNGYSLCWVDSADNIPPSAVYTFSWGGLFVFVSKPLLEDVSHFRYIINDYAAESNIVAGLYEFSNIKDSFWHTPAELNTEEIQKALLESELNRESYIKTSNYHICHQFLAKETNAFAFVKRNNTDFAIFMKAMLAFLIYCLLFWPIIRYGWNTIVLKIPGEASIRLKLAFLFFFACGIPLLSLGIISREYNMHKRMALLEEARSWSVENLLSVEQRYSSYLKNISNEFDAFIDEWASELKGKELTRTHSDILWNHFKEKHIFDYYCVASESRIIGAEEGIIRYTGSLDSVKFDIKNSEIDGRITPSREDELKVANIIAKKLCSDLNGTEMPSHMLNKLELVAESIIQKSFPEIISSILDTIGTIKEWGFSKKTYMTYFKVVCLDNPANTDYIIIANWWPEKIQRLFIEDMLFKVNRNPKNFKVIGFNRYSYGFMPDIYSSNTEIQKFAKRAEMKPTEELEFITIDNEEYIAVSFLGRTLNYFGFIGLYPVRNIDNVIHEQSSLFGLLGLLCIILAASLAQILAKSFVKPLLTLREGAQAIEERNFKHRLADLSRDEFGEVSGIFNNVMVGLEELEIAKIIQESMFPKPEFAQGRFAVYGKTVTMIDVGGDYLDFFKVDDNHMSVLVGDVAGHGVGAAVIMAMAKACILGGGSELSSPAAILNRLHKMILATRNQKQRKIMTFQYIHLNSDTGEGLYGNAGACSPFLVKHKAGIVEEVKMSGAALGAFKKATYQEIPFKFEDEDALVFYTDGIVECKSKNGEMLGYDGIKHMLLNCWDANPEKFYQNIYNSYLEFAGNDTESGDDLTVVVMVYKEESLEEAVTDG